MIYTLTMNPAIDMNMLTERVQSRVVNRFSSVDYSANGKGLNVSFVLDHYHVESTIIGFFGGFTGDWIQEQSRNKQIRVLPIQVEEPNRINIFLFDGQEEYKFVNSGAYVNEQKQQELLELLERLPDMAYLSINGSLPPGVSDSYYEEILAICQKKRTAVILDISSPKLKELLKFKPYLIKPNDEEIESIFGIIMRDEADIVDVLKLLVEKGAQNVLLTLGEAGSYFYNRQHIYRVGTKEVQVMSSACSGDAYLGAFLSHWLKDTDKIESALKLSAATGANVAESYGLGDLSKVMDYYPQITVRLVE